MKQIKLRRKINRKLRNHNPPQVVRIWHGEYHRLMHVGYSDRMAPTWGTVEHRVDLRALARALKHKKRSGTALWFWACTPLDKGKRAGAVAGTAPRADAS
jgi:hypothetical protein